MASNVVQSRALSDFPLCRLLLNDYYTDNSNNLAAVSLRPNALIQFTDTHSSIYQY